MTQEPKMGEAQAKLVNALVERGAPPLMVAHARQGLFDDYKSDHPTPCILLVEACRAAGMPDMAERAKNGEFDGTRADSDAWAKSSDGQSAFKELLSGDSEI